MTWANRSPRIGASTPRQLPQGVRATAGIRRNRNYPVRACGRGALTDQVPTQTEPEIVIGSREQLLHLLAEASEIEHSLMCSYFYAAFSLKRAGDDSLAEAEGKAAERWRKAIMKVAIEEMGHLLMVANLTVSVGGRPHFARPNFPVAPGYFPSGVVVRLSGFSTETLDHFIFLERPRGVEGDDAADYGRPDYVRDQARPGIMPSAQDYETIGHLYEAIRQNLAALSKRLGEQSLFVGARDAQIGKGMVDLESVATIGSLAEALEAIDLIVEQGEGSPADREESHYRSFRAVRDELLALSKANPDFTPAWPVADNPVLRRPPEPDDKVFIAHPEAASLLDFSCATYGLLPTILGQSFARTGPHATSDQRVLLSASFTLMHVLGNAANSLAQLPARESGDRIHAGLSFTMLRGVEPLLGGVAEAQLIREQLSALGNAPLPSHITQQIKALAADFVLGDLKHIGALQ